jgi:hypothetical protein
MLKLLAMAAAAQKIFATLPPPAQFPLVFLASLLADSLRLRRGGESPLYFEDVISGIFLFAGAGLLCWGMDYALSLYTARHAGPVLPAVLFAVVIKAFPSTKRR